MSAAGSISWTLQDIKATAIRTQIDRVEEDRASALGQVLKNEQLLAAAKKSYHTIAFAQASSTRRFEAYAAIHGNQNEENRKDWTAIRDGTVQGVNDWMALNTDLATLPTLIENGKRVIETCDKRVEALKKDLRQILQLPD